VPKGLLEPPLSVTPRLSFPEQLHSANPEGQEWCDVSRPPAPSPGRRGAAPTLRSLGVVTKRCTEVMQNTLKSFRNT